MLLRDNPLLAAAKVTNAACGILNQALLKNLSNSTDRGQAEGFDFSRALGFSFQSQPSLHRTGSTPWTDESGTVEQADSSVCVLRAKARAGNVLPGSRLTLCQ